MTLTIPIHPDVLNIPYGDRKRILDASRGRKGIVEEAGVLTLPGTEFGPYGEGHLRLSVCAKREHLLEGIDRLRRFAEDHGRGETPPSVSGDER